MTPTVIFVDDEPHVTEGLKRALRKEPYEVISAISAEEGLGILARQSVDVVVSDEQMPGMSGSEFLSEVRRRYPETMRIILTGQASLEAAVKAINEGEIYRFLTKPIREVELKITIRQALQQKQLMEESRRLLRTVKRQSALLQDLEKESPGITSLVMDQSGAIVVEDQDWDFDGLMAQIADEVERVEALIRHR